MGEVRDWTKIITPMTGMTGVPEYRIESDGLVRWRGVMTRTVDTAAGAYLIAPVEARPVGGPAYGYWSTGDKALLCSPGGAFYVRYFVAPIGTITDLNPWAYIGAPLADNPHSIVGIQAGLVGALSAIAGLRVYDFPSDRIETPAAVLSLPETPYDVTLDGRTDQWTFPLWVLVAKADDKASYKEMTAYLEVEGLKSIRAAVEADRTLGGACDSVAVIRARPLFATVAGTEYLAVEFTLEAYT